MFDDCSILLSAVCVIAIGGLEHNNWVQVNYIFINSPQYVAQRAKNRSNKGRAVQLSRSCLMKIAINLDFDERAKLIKTINNFFHWSACARLGFWLVWSVINHFSAATIIENCIKFIIKLSEWCSCCPFTLELCSANDNEKFVKKFISLNNKWARSRLASNCRGHFNSNLIQFLTFLSVDVPSCVRFLWLFMFGEKAKLLLSLKHATGWSAIDYC